MKTATFSQYIFFSFFKSYFILLGNGFSERLISSYFEGKARRFCSYSVWLYDTASDKPRERALDEDKMRTRSRSLEAQCEINT